MRYTVNGTGFASFSKAIDYAEPLRADVIETATGQRRWTPAAPVSKKKQLEHLGRHNARKAYERMMARATEQAGRKAGPAFFFSLARGKQRAFGLAKLRGFAAGFRVTEERGDL